MTFARDRRGMTLVDVVVGTALMLVVFLALFGALRASVALATLAKTKAAATALAAAQMEYLRGLSYDNLGTVGGIPAGTVPEDATTTVDGATYVTHTFVSYVDDPADGTGAADTNGITTDYKRARVAVSYPAPAGEQSVALVSDFAPPGIETSAGGGTLEIAVVDATGAPLSGATVSITNAATSPAVDLTTLSDADGLVLLGGAATSTAYQVSVGKSGYSSAGTYARDATNVNPTPGYLTVVGNETTTGTFAIDRLASLSIATNFESGTSTAPLPDLPFTLTGAKTIGAKSDGSPIYKTVVDTTSGASASVTLPLEWDSYALALGTAGYAIADACPAPPPYALKPGETLSATLTFATATPDSLFVSVADAAGAPVPGASVEVAGQGLDATTTASSCGNAYFGGLAAGAYQVTIAATGEQTTAFSVSVSGQSSLAAAFP